MEEKYMVNDALESTKDGLKNYQGVIVETENINLRKIFQQIRNSDENFQFELFKIAQTKGYYNPSEQVSLNEINKIKMELE